MSEYVIPARIENGVKLMELRHGHDSVRWQDRIKNHLLNLASGDSCVLAQAEESTFVAVRGQVWDYAEDHSDFDILFTITSEFSLMVWCGFDHYEYESYETLQTIWEEYLEWAQTEYRVWNENGDLIESFRGRDAESKANGAIMDAIRDHKDEDECDGCGVMYPESHGMSIQVCREGRDITGEMY